jgi:hypothetical protein
MDYKFSNSAPSEIDSRDNSVLDIDALLHPAGAFNHPVDVVNDPDLTLNEKRAILASWASDACAIEAVPTLRGRPGGGNPVKFDDIMDALRLLDEEARSTQSGRAHYKKRLRFTEVVDRLGKKMRRSGGGGLGSPGTGN